MKLKFFPISLFVIVITFVVMSQNKNESFAVAKDFPRDPLIYAQITDLPAFIKLWNESNLKEKYLESKNFKEFQNRHLALKLASRWEEFNDSVGFPIDLETVTGLAENRAAIAVYDIGKLEFVFIAPMNDEVFNATKFFQNQTNFEEQTLENGTFFYSCNVEADRGRQKQKLLFTNVKGRFVLATSQKLLMRTIVNINEKSKNDRLIDEPLFTDLTGKITPNLATIWVNQTALNENYYFKRYWLMSDVRSLKNIRAGIFDLQIQENKVVERREFLLNETKDYPKISIVTANQMFSSLPKNIPFYQLKTATTENITTAISTTLFDRQLKSETDSNSYSKHYQNYDFDDSNWHNYSSLGEKYDENITDIDDDKLIVNETNDDFSQRLSQSLQSSNPDVVLSATRPQMLENPLFIEFNYVTVLKLNSAENLNGANLENVIGGELKKRLMISASDASLNWETKNENGQTWRELNPPSLGWGIAYMLRGNQLVFSNNAEFLREIINVKNDQIHLDKPLNDLTVIRLDQRQTAFDDVIIKLVKDSKGEVSEDFLAGNITSLLNSVSEVNRIEIKRNYHKNQLSEELKFFLVDYHPK